MRAFEQASDGTRSAIDAFHFSTPIRITVFYDVGKLLAGSDAPVNDADWVARQQPALTFYSTVERRWMAAKDTCDPPSVEIDVERSQMHVNVCHLTQFAIFFQSRPVARVNALREVLFWPLTETTLSAATSYDPDGSDEVLTFMWSIKPHSTNSSAPMPLIASPHAETTRITDLPPGEHIVQLVVSDKDGGADTIHVTLLVLPADATHPVTRVAPFEGARAGDFAHKLDGAQYDAQMLRWGNGRPHTLGDAAVSWTIESQPPANMEAAALQFSDRAAAHATGLSSTGVYRFAFEAKYAHADTAATYAAPIDTVVRAVLMLKPNARPMAIAISLTLS